MAQHKVVELSEEVGRLFRAYKALSLEDQKVLRNLINSSHANEIKHSDATEVLLYECVRYKAKAIRGWVLPVYSEAAKGTDIRKVLKSTVDWLYEYPPKDGHKPDHLDIKSLFLLAADCLMRDKFLTSGGIPRSKDVLRDFLAEMPRALEDAFPGYRLSGALWFIAKHKASGSTQHLEKEDE